MLISFYNTSMLKHVRREKSHTAIETKSDEQLMALYATNKNDGQRAFTVLYERHKGPLYRFVLKSVHNKAQADELFQDLWTRIIQHKDTFNAQQVFTTWAYTIARRLLIDYYRKSGKQYNQEFDESLVEHNQRSTSQYHLPEQAFEQKRHAKALQQAVTDLPAEQREVFLLFHEGNLSLQQIATVTNEPKERIKSRYRYAVQKLRKALKALL